MTKEIVSFVVNLNSTGPHPTPILVPCWCQNFAIPLIFKRFELISTEKRLILLVKRKSLSCARHLLLRQILESNYATFQMAGGIEAVNCVRGRRLFGRFPIRSEFFVLGQGGHRDSSQLHDPPQDMGRNGTHGCVEDLPWWRWKIRIGNYWWTLLQVLKGQVDLNVESICSQMGILGCEDVSEV